MTSKTPRKNSTKLQHLSEVFQKKLKKDNGDPYPKHKEDQSIRKKDLFPERFGSVIKNFQCNWLRISQLKKIIICDQQLLDYYH